MRLRSRLAPAVTVLIAATAAGATLLVSAACTSDDDPSYQPSDLDLPETMAEDLSKRVDDQTGEWEAPDAVQASKTLDFLDSEDGQMIAKAVDRMRDAGDALADGALDDRCAALVTTWDDDFPDLQLQERISQLPDRELGGVVNEQFDAFIAMADHCHRGKREDAQNFARVSKGWYGPYLQRLEQLRDAK